MDSEWSPVAEAVRQRMRHLAIGQRELARRAGISDTKVREVLRGQPLAREISRVKLSRGLGWSADSIDRLLAGQEPVMEISNGDGTPRLDAIEQRLERIETLLVELVDQGPQQ